MVRALGVQSLADLRFLAYEIQVTSSTTVSYEIQVTSSTTVAVVELVT